MQKGFILKIVKIPAMKNARSSPCEAQPEPSRW